MLSAALKSASLNKDGCFWLELILKQLFPQSLDYKIDGHVIKGAAETALSPVGIIQTVNSAAINQQIAIEIAAEILDMLHLDKKHLWYLLSIPKARPLSCR